jgi:hypothetical protein
MENKKKKQQTLPDRGGGGGGGGWWGPSIINYKIGTCALIYPAHISPHLPITSNSIELYLSHDILLPMKMWTSISNIIQ